MSTSAGPRLTLYVHTHWDREWYWPFEQYRTLLLSVIRRVIAALDNREIEVFHLDGQTCALDDILEVEPSLREPIGRLVRDGRLLIGPWYVLADQMLVSGESLIRNMAFGLKAARKFGEPMKVGYCPDTFGHSQDLPRILKGFGIDNAVVWRGVPELDQGPEFFWRSPDGSEVIACLLADGYYQTAFHEAEGGTGGESLEALHKHLLQWCPSDDNNASSRLFSRLVQGSLVPVGGDHLYPPDGLAKMVETVSKLLNGSSDGSSSGDGVVSIVVGRLDEFLSRLGERARKGASPVRLIEGELRDNRSATRHNRAYMLPGVLSTRLYLKRENRELEHRITRLVEPLMTLMSDGVVRHPDHEFEQVWRQLLRNHPHDSICGCSVDDVHSEMLTRNRSIHHILDILERQVREEFLSPGLHEWSLHPVPAGHVSEIRKHGFGRWNMEAPDPDAGIDSLVLLNLSMQPTSGPIEFKIAREVETEIDTSQTRLQRAAWILGIDGEIDRDRLQVKSITRETDVFGGMGGVPVYRDVEILTGYAYAENLPPMGGRLTSLRSFQADSEEASGAARSVHVESNSIDNGLLQVAIADDGSLIVQAREQSGESTTYNLRHKFRDVADAGDSYNFDPILSDSPIEAEFIKVDKGEDGSMVGSLRLTYSITIPEDIQIAGSSDSGTGDFAGLEVFKRSEHRIEHQITTEISLRRGVPLVFFDSSWVNRSKDHRLEVVLDTGADVHKTWSENHFSLVERSAFVGDLKLPVSKDTEAPLDRFPCQRFFVANGQLFLNNGLPEYGTDGTSVTMTVMRAISMLSRGRLVSRGGGAGPHMPVPEGNCLGRAHVSYGWAPLSMHLSRNPVAEKPQRSRSALSERERAAAYSLSELFGGVLFSAPAVRSTVEDAAEGRPAFTRLLEGVAGIEIDQAQIALGAFYVSGETDSNSRLLRLLNTGSDACTATLTLRLSSAILALVDLDGRVLKTLSPEGGASSSESRFSVEFGPNQLLTLRIG